MKIENVLKFYSPTDYKVGKKFRRDGKNWTVIKCFAIVFGQYIVTAERYYK